MNTSDFEVCPPGTMAREREKTDALLWVLWHHQGANSQVGQPIRALLGIPRHARLNPGQIAAAKRFGETSTGTGRLGLAPCVCDTLPAPAPSTVLSARPAPIVIDDEDSGDPLGAMRGAGFAILVVLAVVAAIYIGGRIGDPDPEGLAAGHQHLQETIEAIELQDAARAAAAAREAAR